MKAREVPGHAPFTNLTRQWRGNLHALHFPDNLIVYEYWREDWTHKPLTKDEPKDRQAFLVFTAQEGWGHGFLWAKDCTLDEAIERFREGERASHIEEKLMYGR